MKKLFKLSSKLRTCLLGGILAFQTTVGDFLPDIAGIRKDLPTFIKQILQLAFVLAGIVATVYLVWGGYQYITAGGGEKAEEAKKTITNAIIGLVVIIIAFALVTFVWGKLIGGQEYEEVSL